MRALEPTAELEAFACAEAKIGELDGLPVPLLDGSAKRGIAAGDIGGELEDLEIGADPSAQTMVEEAGLFLLGEVRRYAIGNASREHGLALFHADLDGAGCLHGR